MPTPDEPIPQTISALEEAIAQAEAQLTRMRDELAVLRRRAEEEEAREIEARKALDAKTSGTAAVASDAAPALNPEAHIPNKEKVTLFLSLFSGRRNVHAVRVEGQIGPDGEPIKGYRPEWRAMTHLDVAKHLKGEIVNGTDLILGSYPMTSRTHCRLLAFDFDEKT